MAIDETLSTAPETSLNGKTRAQEMIDFLRNELPTVQYQQGQGEPKLVVPLQGYGITEADGPKTKLREIFGDDEGVTFNGLLYDPAVNIPQRLLENISADKAESVLAILKDAIQHSATIAANKSILGTLTGRNVYRGDYDNSKQDERPTYALYYELDGLTDPIRFLPETLNSKLREKLFEGFPQEGGKNYIVRITEENMEKLKVNPHRAEIAPVFESPRAESGHYKSGNHVSGFIGTWADKFTGHKRSEPVRYSDNDKARAGHLPDDYKPRDAGRIALLGAGNTTNFEAGK